MAKRYKHGTNTTSRTCFGPSSREPNWVIGVDQDTSTVEKKCDLVKMEIKFFRFMVVLWLDYIFFFTNLDVGNIGPFGTLVTLL